MDEDLANVAGVLQADVVPGLTAVVRTIDAIAEGDVTANAGFASANINYIGIGVGDGDATDGGSGLLIEERVPGNASVGGFPNAAGDGAKIVRVWLAWDAAHAQSPAATERADEAPFHSAVGLGIKRIGGRRMVGGLGGRR